MKPMMTKAEAKVWKRRWAHINALALEESRRMPLTEKLRAFNTLLAFAYQIGRSQQAKGAEEVRERWIRIRKAYGVL